MRVWRVIPCKWSDKYFSPQRGADARGEENENYQRSYTAEQGIGSEAVSALRKTPFPMLDCGRGLHSRQIHDAHPDSVFYPVVSLAGKV
jgi:hypothetical protein